ncbi:5-formyltetrahydrofolate cyclo-ligase [Vibrio ponticus]|nr:5-formyltetrahydrofolate cyclo-ligase [Vibrio ponticus]
MIHPFSKGHLLFLHYQANTEMVLNQYRILEPKLKQHLIQPLAKLDLICTPLVAFDSTGHRLGMGGGYYDRTLAPWFHARQGAKPIGLAHDCQHVSRLPIESWDVPLPKIVTPSRIWQWESHL